MSEFFIEKPYARTHVDHDGSQEQGVRVFGDSPETACLQIRTLGPVNGRFGRSKGKYRPAFSTVSLTIEDIDRLTLQLRLERARLVKMARKA